MLFLFVFTEQPSNFLIALKSYSYHCKKDLLTQ